VKRVEAALHEELDRIGREPVSDDELERARALIESDELGALGRVEERADRLSMYATLFDDPDLINKMLPRYLAVSAADIQAVSASVFRSDNRVVLTYLPEIPPADSAVSDPADGEEVAA
jgi:predicted Zn-dependent peptidase